MRKGRSFWATWLVYSILCSIAWLMGISELTIAGVTVPGFFQPAVIWAIYALPSLYLLLFLNRTIRTIGPLVLVFVFVALIGSHLALTVLTLEPVTKSALELAVAIGIGGVGLFWGVAGLGMIAGIWPAWRSVAFLRDRYAAKHSSELLITISAIWLLQALSLAEHSSVHRARSPPQPPSCRCWDGGSRSTAVCVRSWRTRERAHRAACSCCGCSGSDAAPAGCSISSAPAGG